MNGLGQSRSPLKLLFEPPFLAMTLAVVAGFGLGGCEAYPDVFGIFAGFNDDALIADGMIQLSDRPGIGFEGQRELYEVMRSLA